MQIKNIIFDVGNVLLKWDPYAVIAQCFPTHPNHQNLTQAIFKHQTWLDLNLGLITEEEALVCYHQRLSIQKLHLQQMMVVVRNSLVPLPGSLTLLETLKKARLNLYALTDNTHEIMRFLRQKYDFWTAFQGVVVSAEVRRLKPAKEIYMHLLETYQLVAHETVFIDDLLQNVLGAKALGMQAIQFEDAMQCTQALKQFNLHF